MFIIDFVIIGIASTLIFYPSLSFKELTRKVAYMLGFGILFTLVSVLIANYLFNIKDHTMLMIMSSLAIILVICAYIRQRSQYKEALKEITDTDNSVAGSTYAILVLSLITLVALFLPPFNVIPIWYGLAILFIVFIPGYLIINSIIPLKEEIEFIERFGIACFITMILSALFGLIIFEIEGNINLTHVTGILILLTLIIFIPAYIYRTRKIDIKKRFKNPKVDRVLIILTIISLIIVIVAGIYVNAAGITNKPGNSTLDIEGIAGTPGADNYYNFTSGENLTLNMKTTNHEYKESHYSIIIEVKNDTTDKQLYNHTFKSNNNQTTDVPYNLTMTSGKKDIVFKLYKNNLTAPSVIKHLYVNVQSNNTTA